MAGWWTPEGRAAARALADKYRRGLAMLRAIISCAACKEIDIKVEEGDRSLRIRSDPEEFDRDIDWLLGCDYDDLPSSVQNDFEDLVRASGYCD